MMLADEPLAEVPTLQRFGTYEIISEIGRGAMGVVYKARQSSLDRVVALKVITSGKFASAEERRRFQAEAKTAAKLTHPNIVVIHEVDENEGSDFLAMELVEGGSLLDRLKDGPFGPRKAARIIRTVAQAVQYVHEKGILHHDLKPANVLLDGLDEPRVTDFGLARNLNAESLSIHGQVLGTPAYMPPEQADSRAGKMGPHSDVYSLGAALYQLLTGRPPFAGRDIAVVVAQVLTAQPISVRELNPSVPSDLETVCLKCLHKSTEKRYRTAKELAEDLGRYLEGRPILARPTSPWEKFWRWCARRPSIAGLAGLLILATITVSYLWWRAEQNNQALLHQKRQTDEAWNTQAKESAEHYFGIGDGSTAIAQLARAIRRVPGTNTAAETVLSGFLHFSFVRPIGEPLFHQLEIRSIRFSPDGTKLLTGSHDRTARIWDAQTGRPLTAPLPHQGWVRSAEFSADGGRVVTVSWQDSSARIWNANTGKLLHRLQQPSGIWSAHFSPDGKNLLTTGQNKVAVIWDAHSGSALRRFRGHALPVVASEFSPDGMCVATGDQGGNLFVWDIETCETNAPPMRHNSKNPIIQPGSIRFSPDGQYIAVAYADGTAIVWDWQKGQSRMPPLRHAALINAVEFSPDGQLIATASHDKTGRIWNAATGEPVTPPLSHHSELELIRWSWDGTRVVTASWDTTARIWDARTGQALGEPMLHPGNVWWAEFSPDGQRVATSSSRGLGKIWDVRGVLTCETLHHEQPVSRMEQDTNGHLLTISGRNVHVWNMRSPLRQITQPIVHESAVRLAHFKRDGSAMLTVAGKSARIWDVATGLPLTMPMAHTAEITSAEFSPDGETIVTTTGSDRESSQNRVYFWNAQSGLSTGHTLMHKPSEDYAILMFARFSPNGRFLLSASQDGSVIVWDLATDQPVFHPPIKHSGEIKAAEFSPDGRRIITASTDNSARVWETDTGHPLTQPLIHGHFVRAAHLSPDGRKLLTMVGSHAYLWDSTNGQPLGSSMSHDGQITAASFSPNGTRIITASDDGTARIWDAATSKAVSAPFRHLGRVTQAEFTRDGLRAVTASSDTTVKIWFLPDPPQPVPGWFAGWAESLAGRRLNEQGRLEAPRPSDSLSLPLTTSLETLDYYARFAIWYADRTETRPLWPGAGVTLADYLAVRMEENTIESLREVTQLSSTNSAAFVRLASRLLAAPQLSPVQLFEAKRCIRRALVADPDNVEAKAIQAKLFKK